jgi:DNA repair exonuclease SbcCD ATPase subunit
MGLISKTFIATGAVVIIGGALVAWGPLSSYLRTSGRMAHEAIHDAVPTDFEIERIQTMVADLDQVITTQQARLVEQQVDMEYLEKEVERCHERMRHLHQEVAAARDRLGHEAAVYRIGGCQFSRRQVVDAAKHKAEALVRARELTEAKTATLTTLQDALARAEGQLDAARRQRETYAMRLANLRAQAETVAIRQELATNLDDLPRAIDTGAFQEVEAAFQRVEKELAVQNRVLDDHFTDQPRGASSITFTAPEDDDIVAELDRALNADEVPVDDEVLDAEPALNDDPLAARTP